MIGAGTIISPIIKVVTTVVILGAVYLFIVRPILDTTKDTVAGVQEDIQRSQAQGQTDATAAEIQSARSSATSYGRGLIAGSQPWEEGARAVLTCVQKAGDDLAKLERCEALGQTISSKVLHNRNFADSYADNLAMQGRTADAQRVKRCIDDAGFDPKKMARCRALADDLLFG